MKLKFTIFQNDNGMLYNKLWISKLKKYISYLVIFSQLSSIAVAASPNINVSNHKLQGNSTSYVNKFMPVYSSYTQSTPLNNLNLSNNSFNIISPLNWGVTYSDLTGAFVNAQYVQSLGKSFAFGILGEYGASQYRFNGTLGYELSSLAQIKFSAERLGQKLPFAFELEKINYRVHQDAYGVRLEHLLNSPFLQDLNFGGYYAEANNKRFNGITFLSNGTNCNGFEAGINCINYRNLAGAQSSGVDMGTKFLLSSKTLINTNLYYDNVRYNTIFDNTPNYNRQGLGFGVRVNQLLNEQFKFSGEVTTREIYDTYQAGINWRPNTSKIPIEISLIGQHITSHNATPDNNNITLQFSLLANPNKHETKYLWGNRILHNITQWVKEPAVKMNQVMVVSEEINKLLAPKIFTINPAQGPLSGGNQVTIQGSNFAPGVLVFIAGQLITNIQRTQNTLTFTMPPFNGDQDTTVDIVVQNTDGQKSTLSNGYTYVDVSTPTLTNIAPIQGSTAGGTLVILSGANLISVTSVLFGNTPASIQSKTNTSITVLTPAHAAGLTSITLSTPNTTITQQNAFTFITPPPAPTAAIDTTGTLITGTAQPGSTMTATSNGIQLGTTTADVNGNFSLTLSPPQTNGQIISVTASISGITSLPTTITAPTIATPTISIDPIAGDNIININEAAAGITITGTTTGTDTGNIVTLMANGVEYTASVLAGGTWSVTLPSAALQAMPQGIVPFTASVTNSGGNVGSTTVNVTVDTIPPTITINPVAGDNIINAAEIMTPIVVTGATTNTNTGNIVSLTANGLEYPTTVAADGSWSVTISAADLQALPDGIVPFTALVTNTAGNVASTTVNVTVDTIPPSITMDAIAGDNVINAAEIASDLMVTGTTTGTNPGDVVTLTVSGTTFTGGIAADGTWAITIPSTFLQTLPNGIVLFTASVTNTAGNTSTATVGVTVDTSFPTITINPVAGDNTIDAAEAAAGVLVTGTTTGADTGSPVNLTVGAQTYMGTVGSDGTWSIFLSPPDLLALPQGSIPFTASVTNAAGNTTTTTVGVLIDTVP